MRLVVIDNYDSFTYNLVEYFHKLGQDDITVFRNDRVTVAELERYDAIVLSPGPGLPKDAGILLDVIKTYKDTKNILGICLGHQAIAEVFGGSLVNGEKVAHGIASLAQRTKVNRGCLKGMPKEFTIGHYHSWHVSEESLPTCLEVSCRDEKNRIMGFVHKTLAIEGIQFHPESVLTPLGLKMLENWLETCK